MAVVKISPGVYRVVETETPTPASRAAGYAQTYSGHRWSQWELAMQQAAAEYKNAEERFAAERELYAQSLRDLDKEIADMRTQQQRLAVERAKADQHAKEFNARQAAQADRHNSSQINAARKAAAATGRREQKQIMPETPEALTLDIIGQATAANPYDTGKAMAEIRTQLQASAFAQKDQEELDDVTFKAYNQVVGNLVEAGVSEATARDMAFRTADSTSQTRISRALVAAEPVTGAAVDPALVGVRGVAAQEIPEFDQAALDELMARRAALRPPEREEVDLIQRAREVHAEKFGPSLIGLARQAVSREDELPFQQRQNLEAVTRFIEESVRDEILALGPNPTEAQLRFAREQGVAKARDAMLGERAVVPEATAPVPVTPEPTTPAAPTQYRGSGGWVFQPNEDGTITVVDGPNPAGIGKVHAPGSRAHQAIVADINAVGEPITPEPQVEPQVDDVVFQPTPPEEIEVEFAPEAPIEEEPPVEEPAGIHPLDQGLDIEEMEFLDAEAAEDTPIETPLQKDKKAKSRSVLGGRKLADRPRKVKRLTDKGPGATVKALFESDRASGLSHAQTQQKVIEQFQGPEQSRMLDLLMALRMLSDESKLAKV